METLALTTLISYNINVMINGKKILVMIVDDDEFLLDMYATKFKEHGFDVELAFGSVDALEKAKAGILPDVVLTDVVMPEMDGFEFLKKIKDDNLLKGSRLVILSNLGQKEDLEKGKALGVVDYIVKTYFTPSEIVKKVESLLDIKSDKVIK